MSLNQTDSYLVKESHHKYGIRARTHNTFVVDGPLLLIANISPNTEAEWGIAYQLRKSLVWFYPAVILMFPQCYGDAQRGEGSCRIFSFRLLMTCAYFADVGTKCERPSNGV